MLTTLGLETFVGLFRDLIPLDQPHPWAQYLMEREGARLAFTPTAKKRTIHDACAVYIGLMHAGMKIDGPSLMSLSLNVMEEYQSSQEVLLASTQHAHEDGLTIVERGKALLAWYADLLEAWKLMCAVPCFAKELFQGRARRPNIGDYIQHDGPPNREDLLSSGLVIPSVSSLPLNVLVRGVDRHVRNAHDHKGGVTIIGRNETVRFRLRDRKWSQTVSIEEIEKLADHLASTVSALQIGALLLRLCYPSEYMVAARNLKQDERYEAQALEMACHSHGFDVLSLQISDSEIEAHLRLMTGACSSPETPVTRYLRMGDGSVHRSDRTEPAFTWSTRRQLAQVIAMIAPFLSGRGLCFRVEGQRSEDLGGLRALPEVTELLGEGMTPDDFVRATDDGLVDESPVDLRMASLSNDN